MFNWLLIGCAVGVAIFVLVVIVQTVAKRNARLLLEEEHPDPKKLKKTISQLSGAIDSDGKELHKLLLKRLYNK